MVRSLTVLGYAAGNQVLHAEGAVALVGHAMDDQELHRVMFQWFHNEHNLKSHTEITEITENYYITQIFTIS